MPSHTYQNDYYQNDKKSQVFVRIWRKGNPHTHCEKGNWCSHYGKLENSVEGPPKIKNRATI